MNRILLVDCHAVCHATKHTMGRLSYNRLATGVIYGFIARIVHLAELAHCDQVVYAWDSRSGESKRKDIFPDYKKKTTEPTKEEIELNAIAYPQFDQLREEILPALGFVNIFKEEGLEADDIIASITMNDRDDNHFVIASSDRDLYQLLSPNVSQIKLTDNYVYTEKDFISEWGIEPEFWAHVKCVAGCAGDGVPGVPKVKELTAIKYLKDELKTTYKAYKAIQESQDIMVRNVDLVVLPFEGTPIYELGKDKLISRIEYVEVMEKFGFKSFLSTEFVEKWEKYFNN